MGLQVPVPLRNAYPKNQHTIVCKRELAGTMCRLGRRCRQSVGPCARPHVARHVRSQDRSIGLDLSVVPRLRGAGSHMVPEACGSSSTIRNWRIGKTKKSFAACTFSALSIRRVLQSRFSDGTILGLASRGLDLTGLDRSDGKLIATVPPGPIQDFLPRVGGRPLGNATHVATSTSRSFDVRSVPAHCHGPGNRQVPCLDDSKSPSAAAASGPPAENGRSRSSMRQRGRLICQCGPGGRLLRGGNGAICLRLSCGRASREFSSRIRWRVLRFRRELLLIRDFYRSNRFRTLPHQCAHPIR